MVNIGNSWDGLLKDEFEKDYYKKLQQYLKEEYATHTVYPAVENIFNALKWTSFEDVRVVILGQDPYHGENQAHGLSFSVQKGVEMPPSLKNIFKEIHNELGLAMPTHGCLEKWARGGVLLLNASLTVRDGEANSHKGKGWEIFTDRIVQLLNDRAEPVIFLLWGNDAKKKAELINAPQHIILTAAHPSPLSASRGFFGCGHFRQVNDILTAMNREPIDWSL